METYPRYIVWIVGGSIDECILCETLANALSIKAEIGGIIYEPLGQTAAEKVARKKVDKPHYGYGASSDSDFNAE